MKVTQALRNILGLRMMWDARNDGLCYLCMNRPIRKANEAAFIVTFEFVRLYHVPFL